MCVRARVCLNKRMSLLDLRYSNSLYHGEWLTGDAANTVHQLIQLFCLACANMCNVCIQCMRSLFHHVFYMLRKLFWIINRRG